MFHRTDVVRRSAALVLALTLVFIAGCKNKKIDFDQELPPGQVGLRKISPADYPDFSRATWNLNVLARAVDHSIAYMNKPSSRASYPYLDISHERALASLQAFKQIVAAAYGRADAGAYIDSEIRGKFEVYKSIGAPDPNGKGYTDRVLFTGYCTPIYEASLVRTGEYQWPLYRRPRDLKSDPVTGEPAAPYLTRRQIESGNALAGTELVWLKNRWEAYVVTVQGSARLKLTDGRIYEVGYAGHNGHEYVSPGRAMVADGAITKKELNLRALAQYFAANPQAMDQYLWLNPRYVFFTERPGGPFGSLNEPVTTSASIATDKTLDPTVNMTVYPKAMPAFLDVPMPRSDQAGDVWRFQGFMMDQDTGGAIRAAGRCDIYMGIGPEAEKRAGHQLYEGELYYIALKPELIGQYRGALAAR